MALLRQRRLAIAAYDGAEDLRSTIAFESFPYTSEMAWRKVLELGRLLCLCPGRLRVRHLGDADTAAAQSPHVEDYFTILCAGR